MANASMINDIADLHVLPISPSNVGSDRASMLMVIRRSVLSMHPDQNSRTCRTRTSRYKKHLAWIPNPNRLVLSIYEINVPQTFPANYLAHRARFGRICIVLCRFHVHSRLSTSGINRDFGGLLFSRR